MRRIDFLQSRECSLMRPNDEFYKSNILKTNTFIIVRTSNIHLSQFVVVCNLLLGNVAGKKKPASGVTVSPFLSYFVPLAARKIYKTSLLLLTREFPWRWAFQGANQKALQGASRNVPLLSWKLVTGPPRKVTVSERCQLRLETGGAEGVSPQLSHYLSRNLRTANSQQRCHINRMWRITSGFFFAHEESPEVRTEQSRTHLLEPLVGGRGFWRT